MSDPQAAATDAAAQLAEARRELEQLSFSVSHDLRAPLRAIDGYARILLEDYPDSLDEEGRRLLEAVGRNAQKLGDQINAILLYSRAGRRELQRMPIDMTALAREVWDALPGGTGDAELQLEALPPAVADRSVVHEVLRELLGNAVKFSAKADAPRVTVSAAADSGGPWYCVADNGAGFDPAHAEELFGLFGRLHSPDEFPGLGAGLAIARRLIAHQGGRLEGEATPGAGAQFRFWLPVATPAP